MHFVIFSPHPHNFIGWGLNASESPKTFENPDIFLKAEYEFQEKAPFGERVGSSDTVIIEKGALSFKSK